MGSDPPDLKGQTPFISQNSETSINAPVLKELDYHEEVPTNAPS